MKKTHDFPKPYRGIGQVQGHCRIRIYQEPGKVPVVICSHAGDEASIANAVEYLAAEVVEEFLPDLPDADPPLIWINHWPSEHLPSGIREWFDLITFDSYELRTVRTNRPVLPKRITLGKASFERISRWRVRLLVGTKLD